MEPDHFVAHGNAHDFADMLVLMTRQNTQALDVGVYPISINQAPEQEGSAPPAGPSWIL